MGNKIINEKLSLYLIADIEANLTEEQLELINWNKLSDKDKYYYILEAIVDRIEAQK